MRGGVGEEKKFFQAVVLCVLYIAGFSCFTCYFGVVWKRLSVRSEVLQQRVSGKNLENRKLFDRPKAIKNFISNAGEVLERLLQR
jgi:hypothetical protein